MIYEKISKSDIDLMEYCGCTPHYTFEKIEVEENLVTGERIYYYINLTISKTAQEVYYEYLNPVPESQEPSQMEALKEELALLKEENKNIIKEKESLKNRLDATENAVLELMMTYKIDNIN